jgi:putative Holliday junction resolvase
LEDERRSTLNTTENLKNIGLKSGKIKKIKDKMSAVTILQNYLDRI